MTTSTHGPGPIIHGQDVTNPARFIVQDNGGPPQLLTADEIANLPIRQQWFTGTHNGLIASWPTREIAEARVAQLGVHLGQILPLELNGRLVPVLCDSKGVPLRAE